MTDASAHVAVCICTYKRPGSLRRLLESLRDQRTDGLFTYSIVVVDNDRAQSARTTVSDCTARSPVPIEYLVEPHQGIPLARNKAIEHAAGDFVALIDDDEWPTGGWLLTLFTGLIGHGADGILGPVIPRFDKEPPRWVVEGRFYERPRHPTGLRLAPGQCRTGNVLLRRTVLAAVDSPVFRPELWRGEDRDFFRRAIERGLVFVWCAEAAVFESIPPERWRRTIMLERALLRGQLSLRHPTPMALDIMTSLVAVPIYAIALPFAQAVGHHRFMGCLLRLCDHLGRLLAAVGIRAVKHPYAAG
jgi:glycosyltransferase involved in cell wall biosynthesis